MQNGFNATLGYMAGLEELHMCECLADAQLPKVKYLIENLFRGCKMLRSIDFSKNILSKENINCLFKMVEQSQIECLAIS
jgi:hypothetical protein